MVRLALPITLLALALTGAAPAAAAEIVVYEDTDRPASTETTQRERDLGFEAEQRYSRTIDGFAAELTPEQERELERDPEVAAVIPDRPVRALGEVTAQPGGSIPPGITRSIQAEPGVVRQAATSSVAVLDTGIDLDHPDLNVVSGKNCTGATPPEDGHGHGTHVAGTIAAKDNGAQVVGVAPGTEVIAVKVLDDSGSGSTSTVLCGIEWVIANRAAHDIEVANLSLGGPGVRSTCLGDYEHEAYCDLAAAGVTTVVAAGNDGLDFGDGTPDAPAVYPEVLTVAAMADTDGKPGSIGAAPCDPSDADDDDAFALFSNYATLPVDAAHLVAAPGVCIRSTYTGGGTARMSGTSMASPHVAGLVALCHGEAGAEGPCSELSSAQVIQYMVDSAAASEGTGYTSDPLNPTRQFGPFAILPGSTPPPPPAEEDEPPAGDDTTLDFPAPPTIPASDAVAPAAQPTPGPGNQEPAIAPVTAPEAPPAPGATPYVRPRLTVTSARLKRFLSRGLTASVTCAPPCSARIRLTGVRAIAAKKKAGSTRVTLKPSRAARRKLRRAKRLVVTVRADVTTPSGVVRLKRTIALS
jgi:subtilisin family serine protease